MRRTAPSIALLILLMVSGLSSHDTPKRTIACKTPANSGSCYWTHGRLGASNGRPTYRLWRIGTNRVLGIFSGPSVDLYGLDSEGPELPANLERKFRPFENRVYGDFEVCPLQPEKPDEMQAACIESAKNLVVAKDK